MPAADCFLQVLAVRHCWRLASTAAREHAPANKPPRPRARGSSTADPQSTCCGLIIGAEKQRRSSASARKNEANSFTNQINNIMEYDTPYTQKKALTGKLTAGV